ncbi:hypothetical protein KKA33_01980 [Patescibacteria group bacterium]|nr:hypothetical protein [Patescibacteria group bacterium]
MKKNEKNLLLFVLLIVVVIAIWYVVMNKYKTVDQLPPVDIESPVVEQPIRVKNVLETTVSVVSPDTNGDPSAE